MKKASSKGHPNEDEQSVIDGHEKAIKHIMECSGVSRESAERELLRWS